MPLIFLSEVAPVISYDTLKPLADAVTGQFTPASVVAIIGGVTGAGVGFTFLWWGARKLLRGITKAATKGRISI